MLPLEEPTRAAGITRLTVTGFKSSRDEAAIDIRPFAARAGAPARRHHWLDALPGYRLSPEAPMDPPTLSDDPKYQLRDLLGVPGLLSLARVPLAGLFALVAADPWWALGVLALAGLTDVLDGWWARRFHQTSALGAVADGATDKLFVLGVVITLVVMHRLTPVEAIVLGAREIGEALLAAAVLLRQNAPARHHEQRADVFGKATTVLQFISVVFALWRSPATSWVVVATGALGALTAAHYARRSL